MHNISFQTKLQVTSWSQHYLSEKSYPWESNLENITGYYIMNSLSFL